MSPKRSSSDSAQLVREEAQQPHVAARVVADERTHVRALPRQLLGEMRADEAAGSGDEDLPALPAHERTSRRAGRASRPPVREQRVQRVGPGECSGAQPASARALRGAPHLPRQIAGAHPRRIRANFDFDAGLVKEHPEQVAHARAGARSTGCRPAPGVPRLRQRHVAAHDVAHVGEVPHRRPASPRGSPAPHRPRSPRSASRTRTPARCSGSPGPVWLKGRTAMTSIPPRPWCANATASDGHLAPAVDPERAKRRGLGHGIVLRRDAAVHRARPDVHDADGLPARRAAPRTGSRCPGRSRRACAAASSSSPRPGRAPPGGRPRRGRPASSPARSASASSRSPPAKRSPGSGLTRGWSQSVHRSSRARAGGRAGASPRTRGFP